jgi:LPPG:FO 2-phospho-L-lactate transferase
MKKFPAILLLSGGVGGAKFADGMHQVLPTGSLSICVNTGDDFEAFGLAISPDLDTVCYTLAGIANPETGWGLEGETFKALDAIEKLGGPSWFTLGDKDLATHLERTRLLREGMTLGQITTRFCKKWGIDAHIFPMTNQPVRTLIITPSGKIPFQEYFVKEKCEPVVKGFEFEGIDTAQPGNEFLSSLERSDAVIIGPSNPLVSIDTILGLPGVREKIAKKIVIAISPIVSGKAIKGPLAKMYKEINLEPRSATVADHYRDLIDGFVLDSQDSSEEDEIRQWDIMTLVTDTIMKSREDRARLAAEVLGFIQDRINGS